MNRLQKSAWFNLILVTVCVAVAGSLFSVMTSLNVKGIGQLSIFMITGCLSALGVNMVLRKKGFETGFDERERKIYWGAFIWSAYVLLIFLACVCIIPFFVLGGRKSVPVYYLPLIFLSALFIAQFVHSAVILIRCSQEEENGQD